MKPTIIRRAEGSAAPSANLEFNIERIVLDGMQLSGADMRQLSQSLEQELLRLFAQQAPGLQGSEGRAQARLLAAPVQYGAGVAAADLGRQIAHSVHQSLLPEAVAKP